MSEGFYKYRTHNTHFEKYDGKMVLESKDEKTQKIFDKILSVFDKNNNQKLDADELRTIWDNVKAADKDDDGIITITELSNCIKNNNIIAKLNLNADELLKFIKIADNTIDKSFAKAKASSEKRVIENFKQKYPSNKYGFTIEDQTEDYTFFRIYDNKNGNEILSCDISENGDYRVHIGDDFYIYNKNGDLERYEKLDKKTRFYKLGDPISDQIYKDITAKTALGLPTTDKDLENHIKLITPKNILHVLNDYKNNYGETLLEAIEGEWGLDDKIKTKIKEHLNKCLLKSDYWRYNKPNCKIDEEFCQGEIGDCWLLSTIAAAAAKPKGLEILNNIIKENHDGSFSVKFKGADKAYTVTPLEIYSNSDFAIGDLDARILEIAANKHFDITSIHGGTQASALDLLCGTKDKWKNILSFYNPFDNNSTEELRKIIKDPNTIVTASINLYLWLGMETEGKDYKGEIAMQHAYAIVDMDDEYVYIKNPAHTGDPTEKHSETTFKLPIEEFKRYMSDVTFVRID